MTAIIKIKYEDESGLIRHIKPWHNFIRDGARHAVRSPANEAIKEWGGRFTIDTESKKTYTDYQLEFESEEQLTFWLLKWS